LIWYRGDDIVISVQILDNAYQPIDIAGWDFQATLKELPKYETPPIFTLGVGTGITVTSPENGELIIQVPRDYTKDLVLHQEYYFDLVALTTSQQRITIKVWQIYVEGGTSTLGI
jgi:hypothetical protein